MNTKTATATKAVTTAETQAASEKGEVAIFQRPRLPYHAVLKERFDIEPSGWKALVESIYPSAKTVDSVVLALSYCKARNLDPFKRPVHIVPMYDAKLNDGKGGYIETIWPGIAELRTTAFRTGNYAGCDEAEFGPKITKKFTGRVKKYKSKDYETKEFTVEFPEWCRVTVYRMLGGQRCKFVGPKVLWLESYATIGRSDLPNDMWRERTEGQIEKCAEAAALRKAFPEELGNQLTADEMSGRHFVRDDDDDTPVSTTAASTVKPLSPSEVKGGAPKEDAKTEQTAQPKTETQPQTQAQPQTRQVQQDVVDGEYEEIDGLPLDEPEQPGAQTKTAEATTTETVKQQDGLTPDERDWLNEVNGAFSGCGDLPSLGDTQKKVMTPMKRKVSAFAWAKAQALAEDTFRRLQNAE